MVLCTTEPVTAQFKIVPIIKVKSIHNVYHLTAIGA